MKISVISVGKIKKSYLNEFVKDYQKRLSKYTKIEIYEVRDEVLREDNQQGILKVLELEKKSILKYIDHNAYIITLAIEGEMIDSEQFASKFNKIFNSYSHIQFIIGGSYGVSEEIKKMSNELISFSKLTLPHQIIRGVLLEQIYRNFKINNNESYHK